MINTHKCLQRGCNLKAQCVRTCVRTQQRELYTQLDPSLLFSLLQFLQLAT